MTDLDAAVLRRDAQEAQQADVTSAGVVDHRVELRIGARRIAGQPGIEGCAFGEGTVGQVIPQQRIGIRTLQRQPQIVAVTAGVEGFEVHIKAKQDFARRDGDGVPVQDGLLGHGGNFGHGGSPGHSSLRYWTKPERWAMRS
ncbi:hypothetical protein D3C78_1479930 [compost metagenome]